MATQTRFIAKNGVDNNNKTIIGVADPVNAQDAATKAFVSNLANLGLGNVTNTSDANKPVSTAQQTALDFKANLASPTFTGTVGGITAAMVGASATSHNHTVDGLSNVTITSKATSDVLQWNGTAWVNKTLAGAGIQPAGSYLTGNQNISVSGDATGSGTTSIALTLANSGTTAGTYTGVTVDLKGRVTVGYNFTTLAGYGITDAASSTHNHTLDALSNLSTGTKASGDILQWNGISWVNRTLAASLVGLGNVTNTSDANKPVSTAQQTALDLKATLASPTFTGTVSGISATMVGLGNVTNTSDASKPVSTAQQTALDLKANLASPTFTGTVSGITKAMVGLGSVDNTTDAGKPVSTAQQTALDLKANLASPTFTGTVLAPTLDSGALGTLSLGTANASIVNLGTATSTQTVNIGTGSGVTTINIGGAGDTVAIAGTLTSVNTTNTTVNDTLITLNKGGITGSGAATGLEIEENASITGYIKTTGDRTGFDFKAPASAGVVTVAPGASGGSVWHSGNLTPANYAPLAGATFTGAVSGTTFSGTSFNSITALASVASPMNGTAAVGVSTTVARQDHVHATDTSRVPTSRLVSTTAPLTGGGDLTADRTLAISAATTGAAGSMSAADKTKLDGIATGATANVGTVTGVTGTAPIVSSGGTAPAISITAATTSAAGSMSAADKHKLDGVNVQQAIAASTASTAIDLDLANNFYLTMTASTTLSLSNLATNIGQSGNILIKQDATGGRTFTKSAEMKTPNGQTIVQVTTANTLSLISYYVADASTVLINYVGNFA